MDGSESKDAGEQNPSTDGDNPRKEHGFPSGSEAGDSTPIKSTQDRTIHVGNVSVSCTSISYHYSNAQGPPYQQVQCVETNSRQFVYPVDPQSRKMAGSEGSFPESWTCH